MKAKTVTRIATKLESMALWADDVWIDGEGVGEHVTDALTKEELIIVLPVKEYAANELGENSPEYEEFLSSCDFVTISVWTPKGLALLAQLDKEQNNQTLRHQDGYDDFS